MLHFGVVSNYYNHAPKNSGEFQGEVIYFFRNRTMTIKHVSDELITQKKTYDKPKRHLIN